MGAPDPVKPAPDIILFDGVCNLCVGSVQFVINHDQSHQFQFASLQSSFGQRKLSEFKLSKDHIYSIILFRPTTNQFFQRSDAALEITKRLGGALPLLYGFKIFPRFFRDAIYNWIANNRYRFFGKKNQCWVPTPELKARFIE